MTLPLQASVQDGILYGADKLAADFVWSRMGGPPFVNFRALGLVHDGRMIGGVVFQNWTKWGCEIAISCDNAKWCKRRTLRRLFEYTFVHLRRVRATAKTSADNARVRALLEFLGCRLEGIHPRDFDGIQDLVTYGMLAVECPWIADQ